MSDGRHDVDDTGPMTREKFDEILRTALNQCEQHIESAAYLHEQLERYVDALLAAERERCAKAVDAVDTDYFIVDTCVATIRSLT